MATDAQVEYVEDLLERHHLTPDDLAQQDPSWADYESLDVTAASELIDWLTDYPRSADA